MNMSENLLLYTFIFIFVFCSFVHTTTLPLMMPAIIKMGETSVVRSETQKDTRFLNTKVDKSVFEKNYYLLKLGFYFKNYIPLT